MLAYFNFPHRFPEGGTIMGPVFMDNPDLNLFSHVASNQVQAESTGADVKVHLRETKFVFKRSCKHSSKN